MFVLTLLCLAGISWLALDRLAMAQNNSQEAMRVWIPGTVANARLLINSTLSRLFLAHTLLAPDPATEQADRQAYRSLLSAMQTGARDYQDLLAREGADPRNMNAAMAVFGQNWDIEAQVLALRDQGRSAQAIALFQQERQIPRQARAHLEAELEYNVSNVRTIASRNASLTHDSGRILLATVLASGLLCSLGAFMIGRSVLTPLHHLTLAVIKVAMGDTTAHIPCAWRRDEVGDLATALTVLRAHSAERERLFDELTRERTALAAAKQEAEAHVAALRTLQGQLVESEKLAALGALVAGVAHEVNSPLGVAVSAASSLSHATRALLQALNDGTLRQSGVTRFSTTATESITLLERNLERATCLIQQFKQVAVDRTSSQRRRFDLRELVTETLGTLSPMLRRANFTTKVEIPEGIMMDSHPGPLGQVLTNLLQNAKLHAFEHKGGELSISAGTDGDHVRLVVADDGAGMDESVRRRLFEPFFTTKLGQGGSGLGMHIVYNIVTGMLGGKVDTASSPGAGTVLTFTLPLVAPIDAITLAPETVRPPLPSAS